MTDRPLIGIASDVRHADDYTWHATIDEYPKAVILGAEGLPVVIPALGDMTDFDGLMARLDGIVLPGATANVHPEEYGETPSEKAAPFDRRRDGTSLPLIRAALRHAVPMLAICRGIQELNVALGGTLVAEVHERDDRDDHRAEPHDDLDLRFAIRQDVHIREGGILDEILGEKSIRVNSLHRQAIDRIAKDLAVEATAPDGTIEAVRVRNAAAFALGVQWHPEYWVRTDRPSMLIFNALGRAARARRVRSGHGREPVSMSA